ncbi:MAG: hypothetical protein C4K58_07815 [Flavobacteriaceae bacterium]|nr:MAG: hypothetical protein C4K58_07815 [Flavobacteriaceae bacterium]
MKIKLSFFLFCFVHVCFASFTISGTFKALPMQKINVKLSNEIKPVVFTSFTTDKEGAFKHVIEKDYTGVIVFEVPGINVGLNTFVDNTDLVVTASFVDQKFQEVKFSKSSISQVFYDYSQSMITQKEQLATLQFLKDSYYNEKSSFSSSIDAEIKRLNSIKKVDLNPYPFVDFYFNTLNTISGFEEPTSIAEAKANMQTLSSILLNSPIYLEQSGLLSRIVNLYIKNTAFQADIQERIEPEVKSYSLELIEKADLQTFRGQNILSSLIEWFKAYNLAELQTLFTEKGNALTCTINDQLKKTLNKPVVKLEVGKVAPNFTFPNAKDSKNNSLYSVKAKYRIVMFWASWCPHCVNEMGSVKQFYSDYKSKDLEIIGISLDDNQNEFERYASGLPWKNYSDFLRWEGPIVNQYDIQATPTFVLIDQNNVIIAKDSEIKSIAQYIK